MKLFYYKRRQLGLFVTLNIIHTQNPFSKIKKYFLFTTFSLFSNCCLCMIMSTMPFPSRSTMSGQQMRREEEITRKLSTCATMPSSTSPLLDLHHFLTSLYQNSQDTGVNLLLKKLKQQPADLCSKNY